jgi:hypothetical protein
LLDEGGPAVAHDGVHSRRLHVDEPYVEAKGTRAMNAAGTVGGAHARSAAFRRSFLLSYGRRIGERLAAVRSRATAQTAASAGVDALPILRSRQQSVDEVYDEIFPAVRGRHSRAFDAAGWVAGHRAADSADLSGRRGRLAR